MAIAYCMVLPLRVLASSNGCKTRQSDWCAHCQDMNTSHRHLYVFTGCRLNLESISRLLCIHGHAQARSYLKSMVAIKKTSTKIQPPLEHQYLVGRPFPRRSKKTLCDRRAFSNTSAKIWNSLPQSLQSQQNFSSKSLLKTYYFGEGFNL